MYQTTKPTQETLREYLEARHASGDKPPSPEEIRRRLGWGLNPQNAMKLPER